MAPPSSTTKSVVFGKGGKVSRCRKSRHRIWGANRAQNVAVLPGGQQTDTCSEEEYQP